MATDALVLVRVYDIADNPQMMFLAEPWQLYMDDKLDFRCGGTVKGQPTAMK